MTDARSFSTLVPGFDFLQDLVKNAGTALPGMGQWVAPTLDPKELDKRIGELRTVQFWLEQNARMLGTTIQALEVQRMTLGTLQTMNVQMEDLRDALMAGTPSAPAPKSTEKPAEKAAAKPAADATRKAEAPPAIDPMQWWSALTHQFSEIAANAMTPASAEAAQRMTQAMTQQGMEAVEQTMKQAMPGMAAAKPRKAGAKKPASSKPTPTRPAKTPARGGGG